MMHRDSGVEDQFEVLCSIQAMKVQRIRMRGIHSLGGLDSHGNESAITPLAGSCQVSVEGGEKFELDEKDVCYLERGSMFALTSKGDSDLVWAQAPAEKGYPSYVKKFSALKPVVSGVEPYVRRVYTSIGEGDKADRLIVGFVEGDSGNWTSFPPHRHDGKPEVYVYYGMGNRFGIQVVAGDEEKAFVIHGGDAVVFEKGYHPNVATPGVGMKFAWIISAEPAERNLSVEFHPEYKDLPVGKTHLSTK